MDPQLYWEDTTSLGGIKSRSVRGASITAAAQIPKIMLSLGSQLVLARLLAPADFGLVAMIAPVTGFIAILADLGLSQAVVSRPRLKLSELNSLFWINIGLSVGLAIAVSALVGPFLAWLYSEPRAIGITIVCAAMILMDGAGVIPSALLNRQMRFGALALIDITSLAVSIVLAAAIAWRGGGYWSLIVAQVGAISMANCLNWCLTKWRPSIQAFDRSAISLVRVGGNITIANLTGYLNVTLDNVMIGAALGKVNLGLYDRAWKLAVQPLSQVQAPFNRVAVPALSRLANDPDRYRHAFLQMTQAMLLAIAPIMIFCGVYSDTLIGFLLGERWLPVAPLFSCLCVGALVTPVNSSTFWLFVSQGRSREQVVFGSIASLINICAYAIGLYWGIIGVAAASVISVCILQTPLLCWGAIRSGPVDKILMRGILLPNICATLMTTFILWQLKASIHFAGIMSLALVAFGVLLVYAGCLICFRSSRIELMQFATLPTAIRRWRVADAS